MLLELKMKVKGTVQTNVVHRACLFVFMNPLDDLPQIRNESLKYSWHVF